MPPQYSQTQVEDGVEKIIEPALYEANASLEQYLAAVQSGDVVLTAQLLVTATQAVNVAKDAHNEIYSSTQT